MFTDLKKRVKKTGQPPGTAIYTGDDKTKPTVITVNIFDANQCTVKTGSTLQEVLPDKKSDGITWVNIEGLHDVDLIKALAERFQMHPLTVEDILNVEQRPKVEEFADYLFVTLKTLHLQNSKTVFLVGQFSIVLGKDFILTFLESKTSVFDSILNKLHSAIHQKLREQSVDYLAYRLIDALVDEYFVVLEQLGEQIELVEEKIISEPTPQNARTIYKLKRSVLVLRKAIWPMREAISHLLYAENTMITKYTRIYLRDVYDHTMQAIDTIETFRDMLSSLLDMYLSGLTIRM